eukprot:4415316-Pyramimonas_sp.AAC.1
MAESGDLILPIRCALPADSHVAAHSRSLVGVRSPLALRWTNGAPPQRGGAGAAAAVTCVYRRRLHLCTCNTENMATQILPRAGAKKAKRAL